MRAHNWQGGGWEQGWGREHKSSTKYSNNSRKRNYKATSIGSRLVKQTSKGPWVSLMTHDNRTPAGSGTANLSQVSILWRGLRLPGAVRVGSKAFWELAENRIKPGVGGGEGKRRCLGKKQGEGMAEWRDG